MSAVVAPELTPEELQRLGPARRLVRVRSITYEGEDINAYEVVDPEGAPLPPFAPGSHIDLYFRDRRVRQYSLCGDPQDRLRYRFAVQREADGRGGSKAIFERVHVGRMLTISEPRNNFPLHWEARHHLLIAGGIGITPMVAMIHELRRAGAAWTLHYCARSPARTAFLDLLRPLVAEGRVAIHWDGGDPSRGLDIPALLREHPEGAHLYSCGPRGLMAAVAAAAAHWPPGTTHCEYFTPGAADPAAGAADATAPGDMADAIGVGFQVRIASTGRTFDVPSDKSIVQVLREHGIEVPTSCESGLCGTCRTRYLAGQPEHRDYILDDQEKERELLICCSRSASPLLVLDL